MTRDVKTRTQRRMEKKQAFLLLVMMLAVSLVSFSLGVMVGKSKAPEVAPVPVAQQAPERMQVVKDKEATSPKPAEQAPADEPVEREKPPLTFFDTLPKGEAPPLGSGINQPAPAAAEPVRNELPARPAAPAAKPQPSPASEPAPVAAAEPAPTVDQGGRFVVQVGSFKSVEDARTLSGRLQKKDFPVFIQQADLGAKGVWHRVRIGPYADSGAAQKVVQRLKREENIDAFVANR